MRKIVAIIGDAFIEKGGIKDKVATWLGKKLIDHGYRIQCGGMRGVMEAVCKGAKASSKYKEGDVIGILPSFDRTQVNDYVDIAIPTGIDILRNAFVANADAVIAIGGGAGTLSEMAFAWTMKRLLIGFKNVDGWSSKLAGQKLDERERYSDLGFEDMVFGVESAEEAVKIIDEKINSYTKPHTPIKFVK